MHTRGLEESLNTDYVKLAKGVGLCTLAFQNGNLLVKSVKNYNMTEIYTNQGD